MIALIHFLFYACILIVGIYSLMIFRWMLAWKMFPPGFRNEIVPGFEKITVIVAARNEESEILNCLHALNNQVYPDLEIIISDDFSEDNTSEIVRQFILANNSANKQWRLLEASETDKTGKKAALERAIQEASGNLILTTDADCSMGNHWAHSFAIAHQNSKASMITGYVKLNSGKRWFEKFQALEFVSLSGTGAASVILGKPLMCNGANLAFTKSAFYDAGGYSYGNQLASGDDTFLMLRIAKSGNGKVVFNKSEESIVSSKPVSDFKLLIAQRKRWASKVQYYNETYIKATGGLLVGVNFILILAFIFGVCGMWSWEAIGLLWLIKCVADFGFLFSVSGFARQRQLLLLFLPAVIIYPIYALSSMITLPGNVGYSWKGRDYKVSKKSNE